MGGFGPHVRKRERCLYYNTAKRPKRNVGGEDEVAVTSELNAQKIQRHNRERRENVERSAQGRGKKDPHLAKNEGRLGKANGHL